MPAIGACCGQTGDKCAPSPAQWDTQSWQALNFSVDDPHYYSYKYDMAGTGSTSTFQAFAHGDLDCDATYSTFMRSGSIDAQGGVKGGGGLYSKYPIE